MFGALGTKPKPISEIMFAKFDKDHSGNIDTSEFKNLCFELDYVLTDLEVSLALKVLDADGNGKIELEEFKKWWAKSNRWEDVKLDEEGWEKRKKAAEAFTFYDKQKNGFVSKEDFVALHAELWKKGLTTKDLTQTLAAFDSNGDGKLQFGEYVQWISNQNAI